MASGRQFYQLPNALAQDVTQGEDPRVATWHKLEEIRMRKLGLGTKFSRHFNVVRRSLQSRENTDLSMDSLSRRPVTTSQGERPRDTDLVPRAEKHSHQTYGLTRAKTITMGDGKSIIVNSIAPFYSLSKPTCGYFFSRDTEHRKVNFGIPASDLVKWRSFQSAR